MANCAVITVDGVLRKHVSSAPVPVGIALYHALTTQFTVLLVSDGEAEDLKRWMRLESINKHAAFVCNDTVLEQKSAPVRRLAQLNHLRSRGYSIQLVVEPDPQVSAKLISQGFNVANFIHTQYALPQWRPDYESSVKPWNELVTEAEELQFLRDQDARFKQLEDNQ
jgi:hypothetical protein